MVEGKQEIDTDLYSRQIGTFGMETMGKLIKMNVLIVGQRGLGVEAAKNLILAGPKSVTIYDPTPVQWGDLSSAFYMQESDVGSKSRAEATVTKLQELNPYVQVKTISSLSQEDLAAYHLVLVTEILTNIEEVKAFNQFCRSNGIGFILSQNMGAFGYAFLDYGDAFMVNDADGEEPKSFIVTNIVKDKDFATVTVHEDKRHKFQDGDYVKFREVEGMSQINKLEPVKITVIDGFSFKIQADVNAFGDYTREGLVENVKVPQKVAFHSLEQSVLNPAASSPEGMLMCPDFRFFGRSNQLHLALQAVWEFQKQHNRYPTSADWDAVKEIIATINVGDNKVDELEEGVLKKAVSYSGNSISPLSAFFGGIVAQEIVKFTGKYMPLRQWLHYDIFETVDDGEKDRAPRNNRYDSQAAIYGWDVQEKLNKVNTFMVGAGALGCEFVKAFALMGLGCHEQGKVSVTDNDNIEVSNLNRQFLFRKNNVGHSKSEVACAIAKEMNPALNVKDYQTRVGTDTEAVFHDKFWNGLDFVVNAVDNIHARLYVDGRCVWYKKPLLESGTLGTKANSQMIVPHLTQCYGDSQDPPEEAIPMCTLRNFPNQIEHCIEWARDLFNRFFVDHPSDASSYLDKPQVFIGRLKGDNTVSGQKTILESVTNMIQMKRGASYEKCVEIARLHFEDNFNYTIQNLLHMFPADHKDKEGQPFWSGPKRCPSHVEYDPKDPLHAHFVQACANLLAFSIGVPANKDRDAVAEMAARVPTPGFAPKKMKVQLPGEENKNQNEQPADDAGDEELEAVQKMIEDLKKVTDLKHTDIVPSDFEKDDDTNFHIDFINAAANLRARNYKIPECDRQKTKMIAGKIIPAIATTTAMITGAVTSEIYKFVQGKNKLDDFKNSFINLALPLFVFTEPDGPKKNASKDYDPIMMGPIKAIPENWTIWDTNEKKGPFTVQQLIDSFKESHNINITLVSAGKVCIYNQYLPGNKHAPRLERKIEEIYSEISEEKIPEGRFWLPLEFGGETADGDDFSMPTTKYIFGE